MVHQLPPDIISQIIDSIPRKTRRTDSEQRLSPLATISRQWQNIVEHILFRDIEIKFNEFKTFAGVFSQKSPWRRASLGTLDIQMKDIESIGEQLKFDQDSINEDIKDPKLNTMQGTLTPHCDLEPVHGFQFISLYINFLL
jgi:hypothetical protein